MRYNCDLIREVSLIVPRMVASSYCDDVDIGSIEEHHGTAAELATLSENEHFVEQLCRTGGVCGYGCACLIREVFILF